MSDELKATIVGFALGVIATGLTGWWQRLRENRRNLYALRSEFHWLQTFRHRYNWADDVLLDDGIRARAPQVSPMFFQTVAAIDFHITDEHEDDNTYIAIISIADACTALGEIQERINALSEERRHKPPAFLAYDEALVNQTRAYDEAHGRLMVTLEAAIREVDRRLVQSSWWWQVWRLKGLGRGTNPAALEQQPIRRAVVPPPPKEMLP
jgi:hypothetical protein